MFFLSFFSLISFFCFSLFSFSFLFMSFIVSFFFVVYFLNFIFVALLNLQVFFISFLFLLCIFLVPMTASSLLTGFFLIISDKHILPHSCFEVAYCSFFIQYFIRFYACTMFYKFIQYISFLNAFIFLLISFVEFQF